MGSKKARRELILSMPPNLNSWAPADVTSNNWSPMVKVHHYIRIYNVQAKNMQGNKRILPASSRNKHAYETIIPPMIHQLDRREMVGDVRLAN